MGEDWPNAIQEEVAHVIEAAGIVLNKASHTQLATAIAAMISSALTGDEGGTVGFASDAEIAAGTEEAKPISPAGLWSSDRSISVASGHYQIPGLPIIVQWTSGYVAGNGTAIINFPIEFPTGCTFVGISGGRGGENDAQDNNPVVTSWGSTGATVFNARDEGYTVHIRAEGY